MISVVPRSNSTSRLNTGLTVSAPVVETVAPGLKLSGLASEQ